MTQAGEHMFWLELREPGCVPERKGPFPQASTAKVLREFFEARPSAFVSVITIDDNGPEFQDGPECLISIDSRSRWVALKHIATSKAAHAGFQALGSANEVKGAER